MDIEEVRQLNDEELRAKLRELKEEQANLRVQLSLAPIDNPMRIKEIRKTIARIKTVQNQREAELENV